MGTAAKVGDTLDTIDKIENWFAMKTDRQDPGAGENTNTEQPNTAQFSSSGSTKQEEKKPEEPKKVVGDEEAKASAMTYIALIETPIVGVGMFACNKQMKGKFTDAEIERGDELYDLPEGSITDPKDIALQKKFKRIVSKYEKKKDALRFTNTEKEKMMPLLEQYVKVTGNTASPGLMLVAAFIDTVGKRAVDIFFD